MATQTMERTRNATATRAPSRATGAVSKFTPEQVATGLGWFSIGLGLAEILAPGGMSRLAGAKTRHPALMRLYGLRELAAGAMIFSGARAAGCWSRVAGDIVDLATLAGTIAAPRTDKGRAIGSTAAVAGVTVVDALTAWKLTQSHSGAFDVRIERAVTIGKSPEECYRFWRDLENLPKFMSHLQSVRNTGENRSHWIALGPGGARVEWDAQILNDRPNECISWRTLEGADVDHSGSVHFHRAPGGRGTIVRVTMYYSPPAMGAGAAVARLLGQHPEQQVAKDLRRLKQVMETGEAITTEGQPAGRTSGATWLDTMARF
jgi:uncharacterized membrane protein